MILEIKTGERWANAAEIDCIKGITTYTMSHSKNEDYGDTNFAIRE
jgi:hypothetical protein